MIERLGEHERGGEGVRPVHRLVGDVHGGVAADGQGLAQRVDGLGRADRHVDDLVGDAGLREADGLLDGVLVELGEPALDAGPVER